MLHITCNIGKSGLPDMYCITGIIRERKVLRIAFLAVVREKTLAIQAISYIKIPAEIESARKHSRMLPDSRNFSPADDSRYTSALGL